MRLNLKAIALATGTIWALAILMTGIAKLVWPGYGDAFLQVVASIYPGFDAGRSLGDVIVGSLYALVDGAFGGLVFGWLYNLFVGRSKTI